MMNIAFYLILMILLLFMPESSTNAARQAIRIWGIELVPSLFPYMVLCQTLIQSLIRAKNTCFFLPFCLGLLGGSPSASASLSLIAANSSMSRKTKLFLSSLAGTISPMFFLSLTASWFSSVKTALFLMISQYAGAFLSGFLFYSLSADDTQRSRSLSPAPTLTQYDDPIAKSVQAVLNVGGCIIFYSTAAACIQPLFSSVCAGFSPCLHALLEISGGLHALSAAPLPFGVKNVLAAGLCGFGGLSILNQNFLFLRTIDVGKKDLLLISAGRGFFSMLVMSLFCIIL